MLSKKSLEIASELLEGRDIGNYDWPEWQEVKRIRLELRERLNRGYNNIDIQRRELELRKNGTFLQRAYYTIACCVS